MAATSTEKPSSATILRATLIVVGVLLTLEAIFLVRHILVLVLVAGFLAVGLDPAVRKLESLGLRRGLAVAVIFLAGFGVLIAFALAVIPQLVSQVTSFASDLPDYVQSLARRNPDLRDWFVENNIADRLRDAVGNLPSTIGGSAGKLLGLAGSLLGGLFNALTVFILTIYFLLSLSRIREGSLRLVPKSRRGRFNELLDPVLEKIGGYIAGQLTVALIAGTLAFIYLWIAGVSFPVALALWVTIAALIPLVGATIGAIPAIVVAFFASAPLGAATLVYFIVYQQVENYVLAPRIMTRAVDISPAAVLLAALIGGSLLGFVGALMAIPTAASIKLIVQELVIPRTEAG
jgi:predicted PurR-regulated permease PerM